MHEFGALGVNACAGRYPSGSARINGVAISQGTRLPEACSLNAYISQLARQDEKRNVSRTFTLIEACTLIGYSTLANASLVESDLREEQMRRMLRYPVRAFDALMGCAGSTSLRSERH